MRNILILVVFLTSLSCNNTSSILIKLKQQSNYIEKEFEYLFQETIDNYTNNPEKWRSTYKKIAQISDLTSEIEVMLNKNRRLTKVPYQKIGVFFKSSANEEIEEYFLKINQLEINSWEKDFSENQLLTEIELELLLIKIKLVRNTLVKLYMENVDRLYYKFPMISPTVNAETNRLNLGETYKVEISIAAFDPTIVPDCEIEGIKTKSYDGRFYFEIPCNRKGTFNWKGRIRMPGPQGISLYEYPIEGKYVVK